MLQLLGFLRPYRLWVGLVVALTFAQSMSSLYLPNLLSDIVDTGVLHADIPYIMRTGALMLVVTFAGGLAAVLASFYGAKATAGFGQLLRARLFTQVEHFTLNEFDRVGTSSLIVRTTNDVMQVQQLISVMVRLMVLAPLMAIGGIILAVRLDPGLSLVIVVVLPVMAAAIYLVMGRGIGLFRTIQKKVDRLNLILRENLTGVRVVRAFNRTPHELGRFDTANADLTDTSVQVFQLMALLMPVVMLIMNLATLAVIWFGGHQVEAGALEIGKLIAFMQYIAQIMFAVMMVSMMMFMIPRGQASAVRINEVLAMEPLIEDPKDARDAPPGPGRIEFRRVTFAYPGAEEPAVSDLSFTVEPGRFTAVIGSIGSGKSTLLHLILRFYDTDGGSVLVDGVDVRAMSQASLRGRIGYVPAHAVLFTGSVADNVRYGDMNASDAEVRRAVDVAQARAFVEAMPEGVGAVVSQGGVNLSGGQRQRLTIARALARDAEIYLFDDSFSALDYRTDANLRAALRSEFGHKTLLVVAQRVSTVMDADRILVLEDGVLVGTGRHADLMDTCPVYREIVQSQLTQEETA